MTGPLLFPVGHYLGPHHPAPGLPALLHPAPGSTAPAHLVRVGDVRVALDGESESPIWLLAHGRPDRAGPWTAAALVALTRQAAGVDVQHTVDALLCRQVLIEVAPEARAAEWFARRYRLLPLMVGLGNTPETPAEFRIGLGAAVAAAVPSGLFQFWQWAATAPDIWAACERYAEASIAVGEGERTTGEALTALLSSLHHLLAARVVYLDAAPENGTWRVSDRRTR